MQTTSTEVLKSYVFNEPIVSDAARLPQLGPAAILMVFYYQVNNKFAWLVNSRYDI